MSSNVPFPEVYGTPVPEQSVEPLPTQDPFYYTGYPVYTPVPGGEASAAPSYPSASPVPDAVQPGVSQESFDILAEQTGELAVLFDDLAAQVVATQGYFNSNVLEILDRVVLGADEGYYLAYRYDDDSYNAYLYLCYDYELSGGTLSMKDTTFVQVYRHRVSTASSWQYLYSVSEIGDADIDMGQYAMSYTNMVPSHPTLGGKKENEVSPYVYLFLILCAVIICFRIFRRK